MMKKYVTIAITAVATLAIAYFCLQSCVENSGMGTEENSRAEMTPAVLDSIRSIGEWQLMTVPLTVQVDTVQKRWLGIVKDNLKRSYTGTMSLGIDLRSMPEDWSFIDEDTIFLSLPDICLLDSNFIDESKTRVILSDNEDFEADTKVKSAMLRTARNRIIRTGITPSNLENCRKEAKKELSRRFKAIGYKDVRVEFKSTKSE